MSVHLLIREDRNHHGYIDTSVVGAYRELKTARLERMRQRRRAIADGINVNYDNADDDTWEAYWRIEELEVE